MKKDFSNCIIFRIENNKIQLLQDAINDNNTLYLYRYGTYFYVARNKLYIIPECPVENIIDIKSDGGFTALPKHMKMEEGYAIFEARSQYLYALTKDENLIRLLTDILD